MRKNLADRRFFRVSDDMLVAALELFNNHGGVIELGVTKEDGEFAVSYSNSDRPVEDPSMKDDNNSEYNYMVDVAPYALVDFIEMLEMHEDVTEIKVVDVNGTIVVLYKNVPAHRKEAVNDGQNNCCTRN